MRTMTKALGAALALATMVRPAAAQADARWQAWVGCWAPATSSPALGGTAGARVCVVPTGKASAVDVVTVVSGRVTDRARIDADGTARPVARDGCAGTETARFSTSGTRVYVDGDVTCPGGAKRRMRSVMSFNQRDEWLDVRGVQLPGQGGSSGVAVARYTLVADTLGMPDDVRAAVAQSSPAAHIAASAPMTLEDIADVAIAVDSNVATAWLAERAAGMIVQVNGKQLATLADAGVPPSVIDAVVALSHPNVFQFQANSNVVLTREREAGQVPAYASVYPTYAYGMGMYGFDPFYYSSYLRYGYPYGYYSPYYASCGGFYGCYNYGGIGGYGGYYSPYYGWYPGTQPIIVVERGSDGSTSRQHGRVTRGGYVGPDRASGGSSSGGSSSTSSSSGSSSGGSSGSSASSSSGSSSSSGRTAVKKP